MRILFLLFYFYLSDMIPARVVLYLLSFTGFLVSFMMRMDINIAIVAMVKDPNSEDDSTTSSLCYASSSSSNISSFNLDNNSTKKIPKVRLLNIKNSLLFFN